MDHAGVEALSNSFGLRLGLKTFVYNISPGALDGILFIIFFVLEPFLCPMSLNPLDSVLAFSIGLFWI